jgi:Type IV secretion system pilin
MIRRLLLAVTLLSLCLFAVPLQATAFDPFGGHICDAAQSQSAVCQSKTTQDPITGSDGALAHITNIVAILAGMAGVIVVIVGALRYITSGGNPENVEKAKNTVIGALIGIAVVVLARFLIDFVLGNIN